MGADCPLHLGAAGPSVPTPPARPQFNQLLGLGAFKAVFKGYDEEEGIEIAWCKVNMDRVGEKEKTQIHQEVDILKSLEHKVRFLPTTVARHPAR